MTRVAVTGAAGLVGGVVLRGLGDRFAVSGIDRRRAAIEISGRPVRRANLERQVSAARALAGADVVVDLAVRRGMGTPWKGVHRTNLRIAWNTLHAAQRGGARRVVLASSNNVTRGYERDAPYRDVVAGSYSGLDPADIVRLTPDVAVRPADAYSVGKACAEAAGRYFADVRGLSVIVLRFGTIRPSNRPEEPRHFATLLTHRDLVHLVECAIDAPDDVRFATFYGVSANTWRIWDIDDARERIGYAPVDDAEAWRPET